MPSSLQPRLTTWQQNKIMESFTWDAEKERIVYIGGIIGDDEVKGESEIIPFGTQNGLTSSVKVGYEILPSGRVMLYAQIGLDDVGGDSSAFSNGWSGDISVNFTPTSTEQNDAIKAYVKKLYNDVVKQGFKISGAIGVKVSDGDNATATNMTIEVSDETTMKLLVEKPDGTLTEGTLHGTITTII